MREEARELLREIERAYPSLEDDGLSWSDYVEQLTYLLVLKLAHERTQPPFSEKPQIPNGYDWATLAGEKGAQLATHYGETLAVLAGLPGIFGLVYRSAVNKVRTPAKLADLVRLVGEKTWSGMAVDVRGVVYDELLRQEVEELSSPNFTPRAVVRAVVDVIRPRPNQNIADPACATGGFLIGARNYIAAHHDLDKDQKLFLRDTAFRGIEVSDVRARSGIVNLLLHGIGASDLLVEPLIATDDSLLSQPNETVDLVLTNPTFGRADDVPPARQDFWAKTPNKQFNFIQHVRSMLRIGGGAAMILPDNVLFETGTGETIRRRFLHECEVHTLLRLPTGVFFKPGVKANILFFERRAASKKPATRELWVYDFRTNQHFTPKQTPLRREHLQPFVDAYSPGDRTQREESESFKRWTYEELDKREGFNLDISASLVDESLEDPRNIPPPSVVAREILEHLAAASEQFEAVAAELEPGEATSGGESAEEL